MSHETDGERNQRGFVIKTVSNNYHYIHEEPQGGRAHVVADETLRLAFRCLHGKKVKDGCCDRKKSENHPNMRNMFFQRQETDPTEIDHSNYNGEKK